MLLCDGKSIKRNQERAFLPNAAILIVFIVLSGEMASTSVADESLADQSPIVSRPDIVEIAKEYIKKSLPDEARVLAYEGTVIDLGDVWLVTFSPPGQAMTGGVPEIRIDKQSDRVLGVSRAQ